MNTYKEELIKEHSNLVECIKKLEPQVYSVVNIIDNVEFGNRCIQLASMKKYAECLEARLYNAGIYIENDRYFEEVRPTTSPVEDSNCNCKPNYTCGSDYDKDCINGGHPDPCGKEGPCGCPNKSADE